MKDKVLIKDYEVVCCHGVNTEEKEIPQRFLISLKISTDLLEAAKTDDVDRTVSYSAVCKLIKSSFEKNCFNLLERLAYTTAREILLKFPQADAVEITVKKPDAPMKGVFEYVGVTTTLCRHTAYLSLGSNLGDKQAYLDLAIEGLKKDTNICDVVESRRYATTPYGGVADNKFINSAVKISTLYSAEELLNVLHDIEEKGGRERIERWGNRTLDIDIVFFDEEVISTFFLAVPHPDMQKRLFVLEPLCELCPNYLHPILKKRIFELLDNLKATNSKM